MGSTSPKCSNLTKSLSISNLIRNNFIENQNQNQNQKQSLSQCSKDSDCSDISKCCAITSECPEHGNICQKPVINNLNLPSIPFNLTITERKKGKTVILSWDCVYNKNKPTLFVVEGRWSLKSPYNSEETSNNDNFMTKWGYLAQTTNNNWIILRSINRGRWYKFRVASISKSGSYGYSQPTELFILSSAPKPPSQAQNLTINQIYQSKSDLNSVNINISWLPSKRSDLPVSDYKISWSLRPNGSLNNDESYFKTNEYEESDEDSPDDLASDLAYDNSVNNNQQSESYGYDLVHAQNLNKYTIKNLAKNSVYSVELIAMSKYESKYLSSPPIRIRLDTSLISPVSSSLIADRLVPNENLIKHDYGNTETDEEDDEEAFEDDDLDNNLKQQVITRTSPLEVDSSIKIPMIRNLSVQTPYFQNGLVKAKLSWQIEFQGQQDFYLSKQQASISSKTVIDQPMFTITWFAIKCVKLDKKLDSSNIPHKQLPTPITATTINTHFEIYELKYNCDYVVNVRLANSNSNKQSLFSQFSSSLLSNSQKSIPPQISSAQFKVPSCSQIKILGRIRPMCYDRNVVVESSDNSEPIETTRPTTKFYQQDIYKLLQSSTIPTQKSTVEYLKTTVNLPKVNNIRYKVVEKIPYSVEFSWSLPLTLNRNLYTGYQISVVPKEIPGLGPTREDQAFNNGYFGSVGAIVTKDQQSFIVRQLTAQIRYIFQIQTIGSDGLSYGPASSLEFVIEDKLVEKERKNKFQSQSHKQD